MSLLGLFLFLLLFGYLVLQNKKLQHSAVEALTQSLSQQVGSKVSICEIDWNFPNSFVLKNVYIEDLNRDTLLYMDRTKVTINLLRLLSSKISFRTIQFTGLRANLTVDSTQTHNYQFFVDAFQSNDNDTLSLNWTMDIESMAFDDCEISYRNQYKDNDENRIGRFNPNDMDFYDLNGCIFVRSFLEDSVNIIMEGIKVKEKSGLVIDDVHTALSMNRNNLTLKNFSVKTPNSQLNVSEAVAYHNNYEAFEDPKNRLRAQLTIEESSIKPSDFSVFKPSLDMLRENLSLKGSAYGKLSDFQVFDFQAKYGDATTFSGDAFVQHAYPNVEDLVLQANLHRISSNATELSDILFTLLEREVQLPELIDSLGVFAYEGSLNGGLKNLVSKGRVSSNVGAIDIAIVMKTNDLLLNNYHIVGNIRSDNNHLDRLFGRQSGLGNSAFGLDIILDKISDQKFRLNAEGVIDSFYYKNYCYRDIRLNGVFDNDAFDGSLILSDENADVSFLGKLDLRKEKPLFHFSANVDNFNLTKTNLVETDEDAVLSFNVETNFVGNDLDDMEGVFSMDNVVFRQGDKEVGVNSLSLSAVSEGNGRKELSFFSDYLNGTIIGRYFFASLPARLHNLAHHYMPAVVKETKDVIQPDDRGNDFKFDFTIENLEAIHEVYPMPLVVVDEARLTGYYRDSDELFRVRLEAPQLRKGESTLADVLLLFENPNDKLKLLARTTYHSRNRVRHPYYLSLNTMTERNDVNLDFSFSNSQEETYSGRVSLSSLFHDYSKGNGIVADFRFKPSKIILNDTTWNIRESNISVRYKDIEVDSFLFDNESQFLSIDGKNSQAPSDSIKVKFSDLFLGYISNIIANESVTFDGVVDGDLYLFQLLENPHFKGDLYVYDGTLNDYVLGDMAVKTTWLENKKCVDFGVDILSPYGDRQDLSKSTLRGGVFLADDSLYIHGDLHDVNMKFLRKYLKNVMANNTGTLTGEVEAYGKFGHIGVEGMVYVKDMAFDVDFLKTSYVLSDTVKMTRNTIELNQTQVFDTRGNYAVASGLVLHDAFRNFKFAVNLSCDNLLVLNTKEEDNETFYGNAYAKGLVAISGTPETVNINLTMATQPNTQITIPMGNSSTVKDDGFITYVQSDEKKTMAEKRRLRREKMKKIEEEKNSSPTNLQVSVDLEATQDAQVHLIMDPQQGDIIRANGDGALHMTYISRDNDFKIFGGYQIEKGDYLFTIQSVISRKFEIEKGSTVQWTGSPYDADINIRAKYSLNAPLTDIIEDPNMRTNTSLVHCLLNLKGTINNPQIKFDIDLPNADEDVKGQLRTAVNTEESMNRNIASLMALGHFYNLDRSNGAAIAQTELSSVGFSTLSSQLTNWVSKLNQDINIGLNYRPTAIQTDGTVSTTSEFDVALSTHFLNDRLLLNGNFGYRDGIPEDATNVSSGIIDFDLEYKLNKSGKLRTKAFNRSNNSYFKQAPNTQGVGVVYREDFDTFSGLLKSYWNALKRDSNESDDKGGKRSETKLSGELEKQEE